MSYLHQLNPKPKKNPNFYCWEKPQNLSGEKNKITGVGGGWWVARGKSAEKREHREGAMGAAAISAAAQLYFIS